MNDTPLISYYCEVTECLNNKGNGTCLALAPIILLRNTVHGLIWDCNKMAFKTKMTFIIHEEHADTPHTPHHPTGKL
jgi:hypothetical protein